MVIESRKIRLCFVLHAPLGGGAEKVMLQLATHLSRDIFDIKIILFNAKGEYSHLLPKDIDIADLQMTLPGIHQVISPCRILKLSTTLKRVKPDLIFSTLGYANLMVILSKVIGGIRSKVIIREASVLTSYFQTDWLGWLKKIFYRQIYPWADVIVGPAHAIIEDLKSFLPATPKQQWGVMPNFINPRVIERQVTQSDNIKESNLKFDKPVIISVGHLEKIKGIDSGIRAFAELNRTVPAYYWILGSGSQEKEYRQLVSQLGLEDSVYFLGFKENPFPYLKRATVFLLPSRLEGFPNALLEAMCLGLPCVVTRYSSSVTDLLEDRGEGLISEPGDIHGMAESLRKLLGDSALRERISQKAKAKAMTFNINAVLNQYEKFFVELAQK